MRKPSSASASRSPGHAGAYTNSGEKLPSNIDLNSPQNRGKPKFATVTFVDAENHTVDLAWIGQTGGRSGVRMPASGGPRTQSGMTLEFGTKVLCGFYEINTGSNIYEPYIISVHPTQTKEGHDGGVTQDVDPDLLDPETAERMRGYLEVTRHVKPRSYPGEYVISSKDGSDLYLDDGVSLQDSTGCEIRLRPSDHAFIVSANENFQSYGGVSIFSGPIQRNDLYCPSDATVPDFIKDSPYTNPMIGNVSIAPDGTILNYVASHWQTLGGLYPILVEHRTEIRRTSNLAVNPEAGEKTLNRNPPEIEIIDGTLVSKSLALNDLPVYGKPLKFIMWTEDPAPGSGNPQFVGVNDAQGEASETSTRAVSHLYRMTRADGRSVYHVVDWDGKHSYHIPKPSAASLGRSLEANLEGGALVVLGGDSNNNSFALKTSNKIDISAGTGEGGKSLEVVGKGGVHFSFGKDSNGLAWRQDVNGDYEINISGKITENVKGSRILSGSNVSINAARASTITENDQTRMVGGDETTTVVGATSAQFGGGRSVTIANANPLRPSPTADAIRILLGNREKTLLAGNDVTSVVAGSISRNVVTGAITDNIATGSYTVSVGVGAVAISTGSGAVAISTGSGAITMTCTGAIIQTSATHIVASPMVLLGPSPIYGAVCGGIPMPGPHLDYITGLPLFGSPFVRVS